MERRVPEYQFIDPPEVAEASLEKEERVEVKEEEQHFEVLDIDSEKISPEVRERATDMGIDLMRDVLKGIDDYVVFASTAMYLHGREKGIEDLQELPGDFDGAVASVETLKQIRERLGNVPGVVFDNDGKFKRLGEDEAMRLSGVVNMGVEAEDGMKAVAYEFEFFQNSRIVTDAVRKESENVGGLNVLSFEGLLKGYLNNYEFEARVGRSVKEAAEFYVNEHVSDRLRRELSQWEEAKQHGREHDASRMLNAAKEWFDLSEEDLYDFYQVIDELKGGQDIPDDQVDLDQVARKTSKILSGHKNKIEKRIKNIKELRELTGKGDKSGPLVNRI